MTKNKGQLSIEFLLLTSVLLASLAVFVSAASQVFEAGLFAIDVKNAAIFSNELEKSINFLSVLSNGSKKEISVKSITDWKILYDGELSIKIENKNSNQTKTLSFEPVLTPQLQIKNIKPNSKIILEKQGTTVLIKNS